MTNAPGGPSTIGGVDGVIGRRRELDALGVWLDGAGRGAGRLVLCAGEPGIGKTRLAQELAGIALAGGTTGPPEGMEARYIGSTADGGLRVVSLWSSKEHADRFLTEKLGPAVAKALGPEPTGASEVVGIEVARSYVSQAV